MSLECNSLKLNLKMWLVGVINNNNFNEPRRRIWQVEVMINFVIITGLWAAAVLKVKERKKEEISVVVLPKVKRIEMGFKKVLKRLEEL